MLTLKALTAFGLIPELDHDQVPAEYRSDVQRALERAVNSAFRETPESVVDQCRNALTVVLSRWLVQHGRDRRALSWDLDEVAKAVDAERLQCAGWIASVVAKLHSRAR